MKSRLSAHPSSSHLSSLILLLLALAVSGCSLPSWMGGESKPKAKLAGDRIPVLPVDEALKPDESLQQVSLTPPAVNKNATWLTHGGMFGADSGNLGGSGLFDHITRVTAGDGEAFEHTLVVPPIVGGSNEDPIVFAMDAVGNISAHSASDIEKTRWQTKGVATEDELPVLGGGMAYDDGKLYALSGRGIVAAIDAATGKEIWKKSLHLPFRSAPRIAGGKLFATTVDNQTYAINTSDGDVAWNQRGISEPTGMLGTVTPAVTGDMVVVPYSSGELYILSAADGKEVWSDTLSGGKRSQASAVLAGIGGDPVVDGSVVIAASSGGVLTVRAIANGQPAWIIPVGSNNTIWLAGDYIYVLASDNTLLCLRKFDGHIRWATKLPGYANLKKKKDPIAWKGPVMVEGRLAVVSSNGKLQLFNAADGKQVADQEIPENIYTPPVVAGGRMFLESLDAKLYSLQ